MSHRTQMQTQIQKANMNTSANTNKKAREDNPHGKVPNETQAIVLKFGLTLQQIMDVVSDTCNCQSNHHHQ